MVLEKRNRMGWKYTFARFYECGSVSNLEKKLDNMWIGSFKVRANIVKFHEQITTIAGRLYKDTRFTENSMTIQFWWVRLQ